MAHSYNEEDKKKFLSLWGLKKYDEQIKSYTNNQTSVAVKGEEDARKGEVSRLEDLINGLNTNLGALKTFTVNGTVYDPKGASNVDIKFSIAHDDTNKKLQLKLDNTVVSEFSTDKFIKDGMLQSVDLITIPDDEAATDARPAGKYLKLTWNTDSGLDVTYLNVSELIDVYSLVTGPKVEGTYIDLTAEVSGSGTVADPWKVSVKIDETKLTAAFGTRDSRIKTLEDWQTEMTKANGTLATINGAIGQKVDKEQFKNFLDGEYNTLKETVTSQGTAIGKRLTIDAFNAFKNNEFKTVSDTVTKLDGADTVEGSVKNLIKAEKERSEAAYVKLADEITETEISNLFPQAVPTDL
jgi:hypothetical protein